MNLRRDLTLIVDGGLRTVTVVLAEPKEVRGSWFVRYEIGWPEGPSSAEVGGADALQASYLAMQAVALAIYASPHHRAGRLYWFSPGGGYGFPMPKSGRNDLVGQDRVSQL
jgi:hypothetical protein